MREEGRHDVRYPIHCQFRGRPLERLASGKPDSHGIEGTIQNISAGEMALFTSSPVSTSDPLYAEVLFPTMPVAVTLLLQRRWSHKQSDPAGHVTGLQFLL